MSRWNDAALKDCLVHIEQAIGRIHRYIAEIDHATFLSNEEKQDAVIRNLEIIGEAPGKILRNFPDFAKNNPDLPLKAAYGTRNVLSHGYFKIDLNVVWKTIERDLPAMEILISKAIQSLSGGKS